MSDEQEIGWVRQWQAADAALQAVRKEELRQLNEQRNAEIVQSFLDPNLSAVKQSTTSGLVEQQAIFHRQSVK